MRPRSIKFLPLILIVVLFLAPFRAVYAQVAPKEEFIKAQVIEIKEEKEIDEEGSKYIFQKIVTEDDLTKEEIEINYGESTKVRLDQKVSLNETVVLAKFTSPNGDISYFLADKYRINNIYILLILFLFAVIISAGKRGFGSVLGLLISLLVIIFFVVPQILQGENPLVVSIAGSLVILFVTTYLAHGISKKTTIALLSTFASLILTAILSIIFVSFAKLTGMGSEDAYTLQIGPTAIINLKGLLLGGIIIGSLGALNDMTTTQAATVFELAKDGKQRNFRELFIRGYNIGKEHVVSLVNTLVLAYTGSALAIFIFFVLNPSNQPVWVLINSEVVSEEIVRTIAGSIGIIAAVPLVTALSALVITNSKKYG